MIKINHLTFKLEKQNLTIIDSTNCKINRHDFVVLLGSNGSGKSSLIKLINKTYIPTKGNIILNDKNINDYPDKIYAQKVITLTQFVRESLFFDLTIEENAKLIATAYNPRNDSFSKIIFRKNLKNYLHQFNDKLASTITEPLYNLSGGEQQILAFALYLQYQPDLLLLDEHTSALDPKTANKVMEFTAKIIKEKQLTCIMTTHNLDFATQYGNRVLAINKGRITYDSDKDDGDRTNRDFLLKQCY